MLREDLVRRGSIFQSTSDTEVIIHLVATSRYPTIMDRLIDALRLLEGAYALIVMTPEGMIACRDPLGIRPLQMGRVGDATLFASETVAFDVVGAEFVRQVEPGEVIKVDFDGMSICSIPSATIPRVRASSSTSISAAPIWCSTDAASTRRARRSVPNWRAKRRSRPIWWCPCPTGVPAAIGYAQESGIPFELGIIRSHYVGRTFIQPSDGARHSGVKRKHNANRALVEGKRIVLIDDNIVRGTTSLQIVEMMRDAGATEVHFRVASPPTAHSCFYGVDTPERSKLLAARMDVEPMREFIKADSLAFVSIDGLYRAVGEKPRDAACPKFCDACFTGDYPTSLTDLARRDDKQQQLAFPSEQVA